MAKIIELCGAPGVGKSSIFHELERRRRSKNSWITASNTNPLGEENFFQFIKRIFGSIMKGKRYQGRSTKKESNYEFVRRIYREIKLGYNFIDVEALKEAGIRFVAQNPKYTEACWGNIFFKQVKSLNGLDVRFEKAEWIYRIIKKVQVLLEKETDKVIIIDEGLVNMIDRGLYKNTNGKEEKEEILSLVNVMPLPDAIVYIETSLKENVNRLISREEIRDMHKGLSENEIMVMTSSCRKRLLTAIKYLESKGTPVLYLDSTNSSRENADEIIAFSKGVKLQKAVTNPEKAVAF